jgi:peptidoglycan/xylan/chitin deacetylase (PgdA/CDA1 family)
MYTRPVPRVALTFDDGPGPSTAEILDILRDLGVRATFFVLGKSVEEARWCDGDVARARSLVARALREGHVVGNHTYAHARPPEYLGLAADLARADAVIRARRKDADLAEEAPIPVRLPYGLRLVERTIEAPTGTLQVAALDPRLPVLASLGRTHVHWTSDFEDWTLAPDAGPALAERMLAHVERQAALELAAVIDLHDGGTGSDWGYERAATADGVRRFVEEALRRGWDFFTVPA